MYHTGGRVDENRLHLPINVPVRSTEAASTATGGHGQSIDSYGGQESTGIAIGPPHLPVRRLGLCLDGGNKLKKNITL